MIERMVSEGQQDNARFHDSFHDDGRWNPREYSIPHPLDDRREIKKQTKILLRQLEKEKPKGK